MKFLAAVAVLAALVFAAPAMADQTYNDATGEDANSADISTIALANNPTAGTITFTVTTANMSTFEANAAFVIPVDSDRNVSTGDPSGFDYLIVADNTGAGIAKWNGSQFANSAGAQSSYTNGVLTLSINAVDLGTPIPTAFDFGVLTFRGPDPNNPATDETSIFTYTMVTPPPPPPPPPPPAPVTVSSTAMVFHGVPTHGKTFRVTGITVDLSNGVETRATRVACTAKLGGKVLKGTGAGHCTFRQPKTAKGKRLAVKVTGKYKAVTVAKTKSFKVK